MTWQEALQAAEDEKPREAHCASGTADTMTWQEALQAANDSRLGGYDDWRLPNVKELQSLVDYSRYDPAIDTTIFPNTDGWFWSSSSSAFSPDNAWYVPFNHDNASFNLKSLGHHVRLVRGG